MLMVFMTAMLVATTLAIGLSVKTEAKRQREEEMIWRGKQYIRGIKLYVRKHQGQFPTSVDDLTKAGPGNVYVMRQAYKDPMNKEDGSWRLLYVGPNGQLIGSLKPQNGPVQLSGLGTPASALATGPQAGQPTGFGASAGQTTGPNAFGAAPATGAAPAGTPGTAPATAPGAAGENPQGTDTSAADPANNPPPLPENLNPIIGGKVIGVGSKVNEKSVKVYETAKNYRLFEFYWDPAKEAAVAIQGAAVQAGAGQNVFGQPNNQNNPSSGPAPFGQQPANPTPPSGPGISPNAGPGGPPPQ